jgi:hypothetical protein
VKARKQANLWWAPVLAALQLPRSEAAGAPKGELPSRLPLRDGRSPHNALNSPGPHPDGARHGVDSVALLEFAWSLGRPVVAATSTAAKRQAKKALKKRAQVRGMMPYEARPTSA